MSLQVFQLCPQFRLRIDTEMTGEKDAMIVIVIMIVIMIVMTTETGEGGRGGIVTALIMMTGVGDAIATNVSIETVGIVGNNRQQKSNRKNKPLARYWRLLSLYSFFSGFG